MDNEQALASVPLATDATEECLEQARQLVAQLETGNVGEAGRLMDALARQRETGLFQELGKMTRELHDALNSFQLDTRISSMAESDIPDAKERLNYVIEMTDQAAHKTLNAVEEALPISEELKDQSGELGEKWQRFRTKNMQLDEFQALVPELDKFLSLTTGHAGNLNALLTEVLMAQDYQDLTGQIIRRVINLVTEVEDNLVKLIRISGQSMGATPAKTEAKPAAAETEDLMRGIGPQVPGVDTDSGDVMSGQDDVDDLLSSLGF